MEEIPENGKESSHSAYAKWIIIIIIIIIIINWKGRSLKGRKAYFSRLPPTGTTANTKNKIPTMLGLQADTRSGYTPNTNKRPNLCAVTLITHNMSSELQHTTKCRDHF